MAPITQQAADIASSLLGYDQQTITDQQAALARQQAAEQASILGFSQAGADASKSIAPYIQGVYNTAAQDQALFGKGFSNDFRSAEGQAAGDVNSFLGQQGAPAGQNLPLDNGAADVLYGLGGYIPGSTLAREGAGWTADAALYPKTIMGLGQQQLVAANQRYAELQKQNAADLSALRSKYPGYYQQALSDLRDQAYREQSLREQTRQFNVTRADRATALKQEYGINVYKEKAGAQKESFNEWYKQQLVSQGNRRLNQADRNLKFKVWNAAKGSGQKISVPFSENPDKQGNTWARDSHGNLILDKRGKPVRWRRKRSSKASIFQTTGK